MRFALQCQAVRLLKGLALALAVLALAGCGGGDGGGDGDGDTSSAGEQVFSQVVCGRLARGRVAMWFCLA